MTTTEFEQMLAKAAAACPPPTWKVTIVERWDGYMYKPDHGRIVEHTFKVTADNEERAMEEAEWHLARKAVQPGKMDEVTRIAEFIAKV